MAGDRASGDAGQTVGEGGSALQAPLSTMDILRVSAQQLLANSVEQLIVADAGGAVQRSRPGAGQTGGMALEAETVA